MAGGVLVAMLFVVMLFSGATVLPIMLLVVILAGLGWLMAERRLRHTRTSERAANGSGPS